jgi:glutaminase
MYQSILNEIYDSVQPLIGQGPVASYIPRLASVPADKFGMAVQTVEGSLYQIGDAEEAFSIQSISKIFVFALALKHAEDEIWRRVGREPSGRPFNSLVQLEYENGVPRNPFINSGAFVVTDIVMSFTRDAKRRLLELVRMLADNREIQYDYEVARSEAAHGHRNAALANFLKSYSNLRCEVESVLDTYFTHCSLAMSCVDLARASLFLANGGCVPWHDGAIIRPEQAKGVNALLMTCGTYDEAGDFAYRVGLPGKSGVGGGIVAIVPGHASVVVWSPGLTPGGNSLAGIRALELFTALTGLSLF